MNNRNNKNQMQKKAIKLLPWYIAGSLSTEDQAYMQKILLDYPELKELIDKERKISQSLIENKPVFDLSTIGTSENRLEKVFKRIDENSKEVVSTSSTATEDGIFSQAKQFFSFLVGSLSDKQYASIAIVSVITVGLLFAFVAPLTDDRRSFYPATSEKLTQKTSATTTILLVGINGTPDTLEEITSLKDSLSKIEAVAGKKSMYRVKLNKKLNPTQTENLIKLLTSKDKLVWFAGEAF